MEDFEIEEMLGITEEDKERFENFSKDLDRIDELRKSVSKMISAANLASKENVFQRIKSHYDRTHDFETAVSFDPLTTEEISRILKSTEEE